MTAAEVATASDGTTTSRAVRGTDDPTPSTVGTEYVILSRDDEKPGAYFHEQTVTARDTDKAIEKFSESNGNKAGVYVAIPKSRFKPVRVTPQTVTTLKLEEAK